MGLLPENRHQSPDPESPCDMCPHNLCKDDNPYGGDGECVLPNPFVKALVNAGHDFTEVIKALTGGERE